MSNIIGVMNAGLDDQGM